MDAVTQKGADRYDKLTNSKGAEAREILWDYARGIGILLVVYAHVLRGLNSAGMVPDGHWIMASDYAIYTFHMPLFFLLAGMNSGKALARSNFLQSKLLTIVYPYFLWSLIQGLVQVIMSGSTNVPFHLSDLAAAILWKPLGQFWFLYALFLCHIFAFLTTANRLRLTVFALAAYAVGINFQWGILSQSLQFFLFYAVGLLAAEHLKSIVERLANPAGISATFLGAGVWIYAAMQTGAYSAPWALPAAFLGMLLVLLVSAVLARSNKMRLIELLGLASMPIYLMHILAASGARIVLLKFGVTNMYLHLGIGFSLGVLFPLAVYYCITLLKKEKFAGFTRGAAAFHKFRQA
ncbi:MAG: acyltransferase [Glaciimonas sp.]|nr:acyltransferase [Glaciimonas sp.]